MKEFDFWGSDYDDYRVSIGDMRMARGAWAELRACSWLLQSGYMVFRNVSAAGMIDIMAFKDGCCFAFDVKLTRVEFDGKGGIIIRHGGRLSDRQENTGVKQLWVTQDGICGFSRQELREKYAKEARKHGKFRVGVDNRPVKETA